jgi:streptogramin lyase
MMIHSQRPLIVAAAGFALASVVAACSGGSNASLPATSASAAVRKPVPQNTEFYTGITPNSNPHGIAFGPRNSMWFTQSGTNQIARITAQGAVTELNTGGSGVNNIVEGPDGNLWFTMTAADAIGRMTPSGRVTQFPVGSQSYGPWDIVVGSDGNLWFTYRDNNTTNAIGRITTAGVVTLFTSGLSPGDVAVHDITEGPDGNVWFTEEFGNRIGSCTPSGTIVEHSNGITSGAGLVDITAGPDGNLWFTENSANKIGRITTGGSVAEFSRGLSANAGPGSIAQARGSVWFTEEGYANVGRITTTGHITEDPISVLLGADIAASPNGKLWITDYTGNGIDEFTP